MDAVTTQDPQRIAFEQSGATRADAEKCLLAAFAYLGIPDSMIDLGCGPGHLCVLAARLGIYCNGIDTSWTRKDTMAALLCESHDVESRCHFTDDDISLPLAVDPYPLVLCLEVAEHIPEDKADMLYTNIVDFMAPGGVLLFSAATPGQGGSGHVNEQQHEYWVDKLISNDIQVDWALTHSLRRIWSDVAPTAWWYGKNLIVFKKELPVEISDTSWSLIITPAIGQPEPAVSNRLVRQLTNDALDWRRSVSVKSLEVVRVLTNHYRATLKHDDNREWVQDLFIGSEIASTEMTFAVEDRWTVKEISALQTQLRDTIIGLLIRFNLDRIELNWIV